MEVARTLVTHDGVTLSYRLWQPQQPRNLLVLLHGMASNMTRWSEFVEHTSLKQEWDILRLDLRGHGESLYRGRLGMKRWCRDLDDLLQAEGYTQAVLVGHSLGAQVAMFFAHNYPARTMGLVLIDPVFHQALSGRMRRLSRLKPLLWMLIGGIMLLNKIGIHRRHIPNRDLRVLDEKTRKALLDVGKMQEMVSQYGSPWPDLKHFPTANFLQEVIEMTRPVPATQSITVPVLTLLASAPTYNDPLIARKIIDQFPQGTVIELDAYHWPLTEKPQQTREAIEQWCDQYSSEKEI